MTPKGQCCGSISFMVHFKYCWSNISIAGFEHVLPAVILHAMFYKRDLSISAACICFSSFVSFLGSN